MAAIWKNVGIAGRVAFDAAVIGTLVLAFVGEGVASTMGLLER